ncbi:MAG: hypothetical protein NPIRA02_35150 [Nitrospirales bacterium]|nr:MAG: hypothetical protein NPIRA02_35150 [Nitrospirales bacterium]
MKSTDTFGPILHDLASTMLGVARESVGLMKRSDQQLSLKLNRTQEWEVYLEFLRVQFNLVDRLSAFHIPIQDQREFMNSLEDTVTAQLRTALAPTMSASEVDEMEVTLAIGKTVSESRQIYERYKFVVTEESKERDEFFQAFAIRVTGKMGASGNKGLTSSAILCASSVIPALTKLFEDATTASSQSTSEEPVAQEAQKVSDSSEAASQESSGKAQVITLVRVMSKISGEEIDSWWGIHPQFQRDLQPQEAKELAQHMNRVTRIIGERFAVVASLAQASGDQPVGHA